MVVMYTKLIKIRDKFSLNSLTLGLIAFLGCMLVVQPAFASDLSEAVNDTTDSLFGGGKGQTVSDVSNNIMLSMADLPGILAAFSYLLGIVMAIGGLLKRKDEDA